MSDPSRTPPPLILTSVLLRPDLASPDRPLRLAADSPALQCGVTVTYDARAVSVAMDVATPGDGADFLARVIGLLFPQPAARPVVHLLAATPPTGTSEAAAVALDAAMSADIAARYHDVCRVLATSAEFKAVPAPEAIARLLALYELATGVYGHEPTHAELRDGATPRRGGKKAEDSGAAAEVQRLSQEVTRLSDEMDRAAATHAAALDSVRAEVARARESEVELRAAVIRATEVLRAAGVGVADQSAGIAALATEAVGLISELQDQNAALHAATQETAAERQRLQGERDELDGELHRVREDLLAAKARDGNDDIVRALTAERDEARSGLAELGGEVAELREALAEIRTALGNDATGTPVQMLGEVTSRVVQTAARKALSWEETAATYARNADFYRGLLDQTAAHLGDDVFIQDDGGRCEDPLRLKIPALVAELAAHRRAEAAPPAQALPVDISAVVPAATPAAVETTTPEEDLAAHVARNADPPPPPEPRAPSAIPDRIAPPPPAVPVVVTPRAAPVADAPDTPLSPDDQEILAAVKGLTYLKDVVREVHERRPDWNAATMLAALQRLTPHVTVLRRIPAASLAERMMTHCTVLGMPTGDLAPVA